MIGRYYGHSVDLPALRSRFTLSHTGVTLRSLIEMADQLMLTPRAYRTELHFLQKVKVPAILHWDLSHYVVLRSVTARHVVIHDPNEGRKELTFEEVSKHFSGIVLELAPRADFSAIKGRSALRLWSLWTNATGLWTTVIQAIVLSICVQIAVFSIPFYIQLVTDSAISRNDTQILQKLALAFAAVVALQFLLTAARDWTVQTFGNLLTYQMAANLVSHLFRLPVSFFEKRHIGDILSRVGSTTDVQDIITRGMLSVIIDGLMAFISVIIMFAYSHTLTGVVILAVGFNALLSIVFYPKIRRLNEIRLIASARERSHIMESIRAYNTIKLLGAEAEREGIWRSLFGNVMNANLRISRARISLDNTQLLVTGLSGVLVIYLAAKSIIIGRGFSIGMLFAFISFRQTFTERSASLLQQMTQFRLLGLHLERMNDIVSTPPEDRHLDAPRLTVKGRVELRDIGFRYGDADPLVLDGVNIDIGEGEFVAIVGRSGSGKTTLLKVMLGLLQPTSGTIFLDGVSANATVFRNWRSRVGVVTQDDKLVSGTIAENITFFEPASDAGYIETVARMAQIHEDIMAMPCEYATLVGDMGSALSEGQKQRILLARALYRKPTLLLLDEGTANLDVETENAIADVLASLRITRVIVAHRPALIERADRIIDIAQSRETAHSGSSPVLLH